MININGEERLILFLNLNYEFGGDKKERKSFKKIIREYIDKNKINFHGGIITFVVGGVLIGNVVFNNSEFTNYKPVNKNIYVSNNIVNVIKKSEDNSVVQDTSVKTEEDVVTKKEVLSKQKEKIDTSSSVKKIETKVDIVDSDSQQVEDMNIYVNLQRKNGSIQKIELEEYVVGVVGAEMPALFNSEALKAQAIIARTYALKTMAKGNTLRDNESNQSYKTTEELKNMWGSNYENYYNKIKKAVRETVGMVLMYNGNYIEAVYHSTSNGITESSVNVWGNYYPYLTSVSSQYDNLNVSFSTSKEISYQELSNKLGFDIDKETNIELSGKTSGNRVESVIIEDKVYKGIDFRNILGLRSADFDIEYTDVGIIFTTRGYGHGVGMSQYGANGMAKNGYNYEAILKHYYPGVSLIIL